MAEDDKRNDDDFEIKRGALTKKKLTSKSILDSKSSLKSDSSSESGSSLVIKRQSEYERLAKVGILT